VLFHASGVMVAELLPSRSASDELQQTRRQLELAIHGAKLGTWTFDMVNGTGWYSDRSKAMMGLPADAEINARTIKSLLHPDDWERIARPYFDGFPHDRLEVEYRVIRPDDGSIRWIYALGAAGRDAEGAAHIVHGIHLDITDRKEAEQELASSREALHQSEKLAALGALLAGVSHELNNPLAAIVGQAEMLLEDSAGTPHEARARKIGSAAARCARIVQTFLAMARQREPQRSRVDVSDLVAAALELTDYARRTAGIVVDVEYGSDVPAIEGNRDQLHQVLVNLIVNAQQAMERADIFEKRLFIRTSSQAGQVVIDVIDTGPGISPEVRGRIFEPFFSTKKHGLDSGTGIGLSFSQGIVEAHGGTLSVEPSERGAHFRIALQAAEGSADAVEEDLPLPPLAGRRRRVLIVEDEPDVADTLRELIEREGFEVTVACDGTQAFFALDKGDFDIVFSDLRMPRLSGPELYNRLSEIRPALVRNMAFITGDTIGDSMGEFLRTCDRPILEKPFTRAGIRAVLAAFVESDTE
jgi:PAS domain S-box-containing protein